MSGERRWLFAGAGNMASSIVGGLLDAGCATERLLLVDPGEDTRDAAGKRFSTATAASLAQARERHADWFGHASPLGVVLAVKPPVVQNVCKDLVATGLASSAAIVSIAAGVRIAAIESWLGGTPAVIRCMPNTPSLIGLGASALFANAGCDEALRSETRALFESIGTVIELDNETAIDAVTAVSGSGPAYVFRLVELMVQSGVALGLREEQASTLAVRTMQGAAGMLVASDETPAALRRNVTSPGGTTQAALESFERDALPDIVLRAMTAARDRAVELGNELMPDQN